MSHKAEQPVLYGLDAQQFATVEQICEYVVPGSAEVGPAVYLDSIIADMDAGQSEMLSSCIDGVSALLAAGSGWNDVERQPYFGWLRALSIEAYYSDFRQPGYTGPGAWTAIDFTSAPMAARAKQNWSFLRCYRQQETKA